MICRACREAADMNKPHTRATCEDPITCPCGHREARGYAEEQRTGQDPSES